MPISRLLRAYWIEARYEVLRTLRTPAFLIPTVALPVMLYVFFGIVLHGDKPTPPQVALQVLSGFTDVQRDRAGLVRARYRLRHGAAARHRHAETGAADAVRSEPDCASCFRR